MKDNVPPDSEEVLLPLRHRMPDYLAVFGIGWLIIILIGVAIGVFTDASLVEGVAYIAMASGVFLLLGGGATGGGYTSLGVGAAGAVFGSGQRHDEDYQDADVRRGRTKRVDARERLRKGLRPEANPRAFWQVVFGFTNLAVGLGLLFAYSS